MTVYGEDLGGIEDLDFGLHSVTGRLGVAQALARRLVTPAGALPYDPEYGLDLRSYINAGFVIAPGDLADAVAAEVLKDERVLAATARVVFAQQALSVFLRVDLGTGPFNLTLQVSALDATTLSIQ